MNETKSPIFAVSNHHVETCGAPPHIDGDCDGHYYGDFENTSGEQFILEIPHRKEKAERPIGTRLARPASRTGRLVR